MQPLYQDEYGILKLLSGQPSVPSAQSLYPAQTIELKPRVGWMLLKKRYLFVKNAFKCYQAYVFTAAKILSSRACIFGMNPKKSEVDERGA